MMHTWIGLSKRERQQIILKMAADVDLARGLSPLICHNIQENAETQSQEYNKQVGTWILFYSNHGCLRAWETNWL